MKKIFLTACLSLTLSAFSGALLFGAGLGDAWAAGKIGTSAEAKAMLKRAVAAMEADKKKALKNFTAGAHGFKDGDLFVFCARKSDRTMVAHGGWPRLVGVKMSKLTTRKGRRVGDEMLANAKPGKFKSINYQAWVRGSKKPRSKVTFLTEVAGHACGVGYYP